MDIETIAQWILGLFAMVIGIMIRNISQTIRGMQTEQRGRDKEIHEIRVLIADQYVRRQDFENALSSLGHKLDRISDKLDQKEDRL